MITSYKPYSYIRRNYRSNPCTFSSYYFWKRWREEMEIGKLELNKDYFYDNFDKYSLYDEEVTDEYVRNCYEYGLDNEIIKDIINEKYPVFVHPHDPRILKIKRKVLRKLSYMKMLDEIQEMWNQIWCYETFFQSVTIWLSSLVIWLYIIMYINYN